MYFHDCDGKKASAVIAFLLQHGVWRGLSDSATLPKFTLFLSGLSGSRFLRLKDSKARLQAPTWGFNAFFVTPEILIMSMFAFRMDDAA